MEPGNFIIDTVTRAVVVQFSQFAGACSHTLFLSLSLPSSSFLPKIRAILKETHLELYSMTEVQLSLTPVSVACIV